MKRSLRSIGLFLALALIVFGCQNLRHSGQARLPDPPPDGLRVATHNVHYILVRQDTGRWSMGDWLERRDALDTAFKALDADIVAYQEMESFAGGHMSRENLALDWLLDNNPGYGAAAVGDPARFPSTQPILYRKETLQPADQGWFFFSDTPDVIYSRTFNGSYPAFASWATFRRLSDDKTFTVLNIHTDFRSRSNRLQSATLVAKRAAPLIKAQERVILVGDLNARNGDRTLEILENAGFSFLPIDGATYHFDRGINLFAAIDHIALAGPIAATGPTGVLRRKFDGMWPSDHYPVTADIRLESESRK